MRILSGDYDTALVIALCKGSENPENDACTLMYADPFYQRLIGMNETVAAALQMRMYIERYGITEEQCAKVVVKIWPMPGESLCPQKRMLYRRRCPTLG